MCVIFLFCLFVDRIKRFHTVAILLIALVGTIDNVVADVQNGNAFVFASARELVGVATYDSRAGYGNNTVKANTKDEGNDKIIKKKKK